MIESEASGEGSYMDEDLENLKVSTGLDTVQLGSIGVYHYRVSDSPSNISTVSIIVNGGPKVYQTSLKRVFYYFFSIILKDYFLLLLPTQHTLNFIIILESHHPRDRSGV